MAQAIPLENIYYLLAYAWDRLDEADLTLVSGLSAHSLAELFARVLRSGVSHLLLRGLDRSYVSKTEELSGVRGRIEIAASLQRVSFPQGRAVCSFDELSIDTPANRIIKSTLRHLAAETTLSTQDAESLRDLYRRLPGVATLALQDSSFRRVNVAVNRSQYGFLLDVCELVHHNLLMDEKSGEFVFRDFTRDNKQMARLFELFLRRFYAREQQQFAVVAPKLQWDADGPDSVLAYLPEMRTDLVLRSSSQTIVIDAKYYAEALSRYFEKDTIRSDHLYQMAAYLRHISVGLPASRVCGMLLYPRTTESLHFDFSLQGHPFRIATVNLAQHWTTLHQDLLSLVPALSTAPS
jgi:5-methylcytosine-specific restriction enzyme subunit McrC